MNLDRFPFYSQVLLLTFVPVTGSSGDRNHWAHHGVRTEIVHLKIQHNKKLHKNSPTPINLQSLMTSTVKVSKV